MEDSEEEVKHDAGIENDFSRVASRWYLEQGT